MSIEESAQSKQKVLNLNRTDIAKNKREKEEKKHFSLNGVKKKENRS